MLQFYFTVHSYFVSTVIWNHHFYRIHQVSALIFCLYGLGGKLRCAADPIDNALTFVIPAFTIIAKHLYILIQLNLRQLVAGHISAQYDRRKVGNLVKGLSNTCHFVWL